MGGRGRILGKVVAFWVAGCVVSIGLAWGIDLWLGSVEPPERNAPRVWVTVPVESVDWWPQEELHSDAVEGTRVGIGSGITIGIVDEHAPHAFSESACIQTGWPLRCVSRRQAYFSAGGYGSGYVDHDRSAWLRGVTVWPLQPILTGGRPPPEFIRERRIALRPMVAGVVVDGAVFGAALGLAVRGLAGVRAWRRGLANQCTTRA